MGMYFFDTIKRVLREEYYDTSFRGMDIEKIFKSTDERLRSMANLDQMYLMVSEALMDLDDSHTYLLPPTKVKEPEYGFTTMMVGDQCLVTSVDKASQAYATGLRPGDQILSFGATVPNRRNYWKLKLVLYALNPLAKIKLNVSGVDGKKRELEIQSAFVSSKEREEAVNKINEQRAKQPFSCKDVSTEMILCKIWSFDVREEAFQNLFKDITAKKKLILDLRGTRDGREDTVLDFTGHFFAKDVVAFRVRRRGQEKERIARGQAGPFTGELAVVVDSVTSGPAEIFARVIQLENRGKLYGDVTAGAVTSSDVLIVQVPRYPGYQPGMDTVTLMGISVGEPVMRDGSRLEGTGLIPDVPLGPSGYAIRENLDPILSHVAGSLGAQLTPNAAGAFGFMIPTTIEMIEVRSRPTKKEVKVPRTI